MIEHLGYTIEREAGEWVATPYDPERVLRDTDLERLKARCDAMRTEIETEYDDMMAPYREVAP